MQGLNDTIRRLRTAAMAAKTCAPISTSERLRELQNNRANPGALRAEFYAPKRTALMPLVVVLHGCTQNAAGYDHGSGWSALAEKHGFALLLPEQQRTNNPNLCFNWFLAGDTRRGSGEALSIREMIAVMVERHAIDPARVFVTGLSAGGAMTSVMLATYPEVFAAGAIIAGLPFGIASTMPQALQLMRGQGHLEAGRCAELVRTASGHRGPWPAVSVWHGDADMTVVPSNAEAILGQWRFLHGLAATADRREVVDGAVRRQWLDGDGDVCLEDYRIARMGHGTPLSTKGERAGGSPMPHMLDVGISSTWHIAAGWGILDPDFAGDDAIVGDDALPPNLRAEPSILSDAFGVQATIETALRSAELMR